MSEMCADGRFSPNRFWDLRQVVLYGAGDFSPLHFLFPSSSDFSRSYSEEKA